MELRRTGFEDIDTVLLIIGQAKNYLREHGINQWQNEYPNKDTIVDDVQKGHGYVLLKDDIITGTVAVTFDGEKTYNRIDEGEWVSDKEYATIHRIAVDEQCKGSGLASVIIGYVVKMCHSRDVRSIRVDTHRKNRSMQRMLLKNGFQYCGIIYLEDHSERIAFEKILAD